jgi:hypothetical protein
MLTGGTDGPVVVPGRPEESVLIQAVLKKNAHFKMPPSGQHSSDEVDSLRAGGDNKKLHASTEWPA